MYLPPGGTRKRNGMTTRLKKSALGLLVAIVALVLGSGSGLAQSAGPIDLSQFVVDPSVLGDGWTIKDQGADTMFQHLTSAPSAIA